jgi:hypothetical protein
MPQILSAHIVCPRPKVWDFDEKRLHWASVVRGKKEKRKFKTLKKLYKKVLTT